MSEKGEKIRAAKEAQRKRLRSQTVTVDQHWKILRTDPLNWELRYKGKFKGYYGTITDAIRALPSKMLDEVAKNDLAEVLRSLQGIEETIERAIP